ncbi:MAG: TatD family hydrolase [Verrucomicrobiae bacterium]|nr:TatD family hydrolase [Verrucomicrobiae bacterium]
MHVELYDSHLHLQDPRLKSVLTDIAATYANLGVERVIVNGTQESDWEGVGQLSELFPFVKPAFGLHPWHIFNRSPHWLGNLEYCIDHYNGFVGEIGLDRWIQNYDFDDQVEVFKKQLRLAATKKVPASIHCLNAWGKMLEILEEEKLPQPGVLLHSYGGAREMVPQLVELGCYFSFSGYFLIDRKVKARETFKTIPIERILVETDAPDQRLPPDKIAHPLPEDEEGKTVNHPANILAVYEGLAKVLDMSVDRLADQVAENYRRIFG